MPVGKSRQATTAHYEPGTVSMEQYFEQGLDIHTLIVIMQVRQSAGQLGGNA